ncbi:trans-aconitate 2-methyltransferase [Gloeocapsa sp. PCC 73106]|uniref:class I SAM-dependent methyltransferase n=1 Tax=Gloeocapsa sp. PCC 73106 TaxID=102232 RepID=UPI0002ACCAF7|nr:class I SAM-dependent methyltransferase [Gloeocapsa sp. PCC 73106]ELR98358.1 methylase involved in ubiquinone/menaquinone biosynthesis [Gloeocapsa sp. PCC 73106]
MNQPPTIYPGEVFADTSDFDLGIRQLIPRYDEMLEVITLCVPVEATHLIELGCGTGELTLKLLKRCPNARLISLDYSPRMVASTKAKVVEQGYQERCQVLSADFGEWATGGQIEGNIPTNCDACVSSLAIHHLSDEMKGKLFKCIAQHLKPGGYFWNADPVLPESSYLADTYETQRTNWIEQQGTTREAIKSKLGQSEAYGYSGQDRLATLADHLALLQLAGFRNVAVPWKYFNLAVFGGWV